MPCNFTCIPVSSLMLLNMPINAVILDMDGLMLDTEPLYRTAWQKACAEFGFVLSDAQYVRFIGRRSDEAESLLFEEFGSDFPIDTFRTARRKHELSIFSTAPLRKKPGIEELLDFLKSRQLPKAVATMTARKKTIGRLSGAGLLDRFDVLACGDEVANGKPAPDLFLLAAQRLDVQPRECLVLEDAEPGVVAAHRAGMQVYVVPDLNPPSAAVERIANGKFESLIAVACHLDRYFGSFESHRVSERQPSGN